MSCNADRFSSYKTKMYQSKNNEFHAISSLDLNLESHACSLISSLLDGFLSSELTSDWFSWDLTLHFIFLIGLKPEMK